MAFLGQMQALIPEIMAEFQGGVPINSRIVQPGITFSQGVGNNVRAAKAVRVNGTFGARRTSGVPTVLGDSPLFFLNKLVAAPRSFLESMVSDDHVGGFFRDHNGRRIGVG